MLGDNACVLWRIPRGVTIRGLAESYTRSAQYIKAVRADWQASKASKKSTAKKQTPVMRKRVADRKAAAKKLMAKGAEKTCAELSVWWGLSPTRTHEVILMIPELQKSSVGIGNVIRWKWVEKGAK